MHQLKSRQICLFFIAFVPVTKVFILPSIIASISKNDMWLSCLLSHGFDLITIVSVLFACRKYRTDFFTLLENSLGKTLSNALLVFFAIIFFVKAILPVNDLRNYVEITLYETLPSSIYFLPFFVVCFYFCSKPLRVLGRISDVMWIMTSLGMVLLFALSISNFKFSNIFPIGVNGIGSIIKGSYFTHLWYGDGIYLLFFIGNFAYKKRDGLKIILGFLIGVILTAFFMLLFYTIFTFISPRQTYSLTEISKYSTVINNIGRFDYIGIALILFSNLFASSLPIYFAVLCLQRVFHTDRKWHISLGVTALCYLIITIFREYFYSIEKFLLSYGNILFLTTFNLIPIIIAFCPLKENRRET